MKFFDRLFGAKKPETPEEIGTVVEDAIGGPLGAVLGQLTELGVTELKKSKSPARKTSASRRKANGQFEKKN